MVGHSSYFTHFANSLNIGDEVLSFLLNDNFDGLSAEESDTVSEHHHLKVHLFLLSLEKGVKEVCTGIACLSPCEYLLV